MCSTLRARGYAITKTDIFVLKLEELFCEISSRNKGRLQAYCNTNRGKTCFFYNNCKLKAGDTYKKGLQHLSQCVDCKSNHWQRQKLCRRASKSAIFSTQIRFGSRKLGLDGCRYWYISLKCIQTGNIISGRHSRWCARKLVIETKFKCFA